MPELDQKKLMIYGAVGVVGIVLLSKLTGSKEKTGSEQPATGQIVNMSASGGTEAQQIAAQERLGMQEARMAGLTSLLDYSTSGKTLESGERVMNRQLDSAEAINSQNVERDLKSMSMQVSAATTAAQLQASVAMAQIGSQVSIASIMAGVQNEKTQADLKLGLRGYDSEDTKTGAQKEVSLAQIDLERFGISTAADSEKYLADIQYRLGSKALKFDWKKANLGADTAVTLSKQQTELQHYSIQKQAETANRKSMFDFLSGIGSLIGGFF